MVYHYINGTPATYNEKASALTLSLFSAWICPECNTYLAKNSLICLNACHISVAEYRKFTQGLKYK